MCLSQKAEPLSQERSNIFFMIKFELKDQFFDECLIGETDKYSFKSSFSVGFAELAGLEISLRTMAERT